MIGDEENQQHAFTKALVESIEAVAPLFDAADGMKADLERRGWSPTAAEQVVQQWVSEMMRLIFKQ